MEIYSNDVVERFRQWHIPHCIYCVLQKPKKKWFGCCRDVNYMIVRSQNGKTVYIDYKHHNDRRLDINYWASHWPVTRNDWVLSKPWISQFLQVLNVLLIILILYYHVSHISFQSRDQSVLTLLIVFGRSPRSLIHTLRGFLVIS